MTMAPIAALSEIVSTIVRPCISMCEFRISRAGTTYAVASRTSKIVVPGPASGVASTKASSTSMRTFENRSNSTVVPDSNTMSSKITP
jgi:hypothetical protein